MFLDPLFILQRLLDSFLDRLEGLGKLCRLQEAAGSDPIDNVVAGDDLALEHVVHGSHTIRPSSCVREVQICGLLVAEVQIGHVDVEEGVAVQGPCRDAVFVQKLLPVIQRREGWQAPLVLDQGVGSAADDVQDCDLHTGCPVSVVWPRRLSPAP